MTRSRIVSTCSIALLAACALLALAIVPALSAARPKPSSHTARSRHSHKGRGRARYVRGRLSASGYTIAVVGFNGKAVLGHGRSFKLRAPDARVTLQLIDRHGVYAGPVVVGGRSKHVIMGVKAGVNVGTIVVVPAKGYGHLAHRLPGRDLVRARWAHARHGVPIGNGRNLGLVHSSGRGGGSGQGQDEAHIGIPNLLNIAVPGTTILKNLAPPKSLLRSSSKGRRASVASAARRPAARIAGNEGEGAPPPGGPVPPGGEGPSQGPVPPGGEGPVPPGGEGPAKGAPPAPGGGPGAPPPPSMRWMSQMFLETSDTLNADVAGVTVSQIDATLKAQSNLKLLNIPASASLLELDCNGLSFCSQGGTGQAALEGLPQSPAPAPAPGEPASGGPAPGEPAPGAPAPGEPAPSSGPTAGPSAGMTTIPFPAGALDTATGFGEVVGPAVPEGLLGSDGGAGREFSLNPNATSSQIGSGDVITALLTQNGATTQLPVTIGFVFNTVPAIVAWSDTAGDSGTIGYPDTSGVGTQTNPLKVAAGPNGDVVMSFTLYRPQRQGVPGAGEPALMDIGHLGYELDYAVSGGEGGASMGPQCPASVYSGLSSTLTLQNGAEGGQANTEYAAPPGDGELIDAANDQPVSPANTIGFTADLTQCLAGKGVSSFPVGQPELFDISANSQSSNDHANQNFTVERVR